MLHFTAQRHLSILGSILYDKKSIHLKILRTCTFPNTSPFFCVHITGTEYKQHLR